LGVVRFIRFPSLVILEALPGHTERQDEGEGCDGTEGTERGDEGYALQYGADEEVDIGVAFELDDEGVGEEGDQVVLGRRDVVRLGFFARSTRDLNQKL
jgi:hypothetical protein